jgi:hypothetical protein
VIGDGVLIADAPLARAVFAARRVGFSGVLGAISGAQEDAVDLSENRAAWLLGGAGTVSLRLVTSNFARFAFQEGPLEQQGRFIPHGPPLIEGSVL